MSEKVCAVVVTFNRKNLLRRCLRAVLGQTRAPDKVLVVNNASTDGTHEVLAKEFPQVEVLNLPKNIGGAGGFYEGIKWAYERGFEWIWAMDDDGMPYRDNLQNLMNTSVDLMMRGSLVISSTDATEEKLAFKMLSEGGKEISTHSEARSQAGTQGVIFGWVTLYNGVLIQRKLVERIGLPLKDLFIWGDELEYFWRAKNAGVPLGTVVKARFLHPPTRQKRITIKLGHLRLTLPYSEDETRMFLIIRNSTLLYMRHLGVSKWVLKVVLYMLIFPRKIHLITRGIIEGVKMAKGELSDWRAKGESRRDVGRPE